MAIADPGRWEFKLPSAASDKELPIPPEQPEAAGLTAGSLPLPEYARSPGDVHGRIEYRVKTIRSYWAAVPDPKLNFQDLKFDFDVWIEKIFIDCQTYIQNLDVNPIAQFARHYILTDRDFISTDYTTSNFADATWIAAVTDATAGDSNAKITHIEDYLSENTTNHINSRHFSQFFPFYPSGFYLSAGKALRFALYATKGNPASLGAFDVNINSIVYYRIFKMG